MKAVIDRFEGKMAVLLIDDQPMTVPRRSLPRGVHEGDHLEVTLEAGQLVEASIDREATERARQRIAEKLEHLRRGDHLRDENDPS